MATIRLMHKAVIGRISQLGEWLTSFVPAGIRDTLSAKFNDLKKGVGKIFKKEEEEEDVWYDARKEEEDVWYDARKEEEEIKPKLVEMAINKTVRTRKFEGRLNIGYVKYLDLIREGVVKLTNEQKKPIKSRSVVSCVFYKLTVEGERITNKGHFSPRTKW